MNLDLGADRFENRVSNLQVVLKSGGADETRTRDLRRDRPAF